MEEPLKVDSPEDRSTHPIAVQDPVLEETSQPFVGQWNQLISTTNWEKGQIIGQWRQALIEAGAPATEYSDEAWAQRVGGVTGQHVGRLRRVHERFGGSFPSYSNLYWSHFHAALDWDDAEMWLEGARQSGWSVSKMRRQRWEALGASPEMKPRDEDIVVGEVDEDFQPARESESDTQRLSGQMAEVQGPPIPEGPDFGDEDEANPASADGAAIFAEDAQGDSVACVRPFEKLNDLPDDMADAFEAMKLAILRHKAEDWDQISRDDVLAALDSLKQLAVAPAVD